MSDIIEVNIDKDEYIKNAGTTLTQWSYGQVLRITGLDLPETVEIHFSLNDRHGEAPIVLGKTVNGVTDVAIPSFIMEGPECTTSDYYKAYAFIYPSDEESGKTIHKIVLKFKTRPKPADWIPPDQETTLGEVLDMINGKVEKSGHKPNMFLGTDENGNVVTKEQKEYELPVASEDNLGGVEPVTKTEDMTQAVGVDKEGRLFTEPSGIDEATFLKLAIKPTTEEASFHNITDSADYRVLAFATKGKTEQETTSGKNLFDLASSNGYVSQFTGVSNEIDLENNTIKTTNTYTATRTIHLDLGFLEAGDYTFSLQTDSASSFIIKKGTTGNSTNITSFGAELGYKSFTLDEDSNVIIETFVNAEKTLTYQNIQLEKASTATTYEPYTGGAASPNPQFPQEIIHAGVYDAESGRYKVDVEVCNANFFDGELLTSFFADTKGNMSSAAEYHEKFRSILVNLPQGTYTVVSSEKCNFVRFLENDTLTIIGVSNTSYTFTTVGGVVGVSFKKQDNTIWDDSITIQVEKGTAATPYIPHQAQHITLTSARPITKWDKLEKRDGVYGWVYRGKQYILDNTYNWYEYSNYEYNGFCCTPPLDFKHYRREGYCNQLIANVEHNDGMWLGADNSIFYTIHSRFYDASLKDKGLANWKAHLQANPLEVWTYSDTEEFVPLLQEEQDALNAVVTYYPVTNVSNNQDMPMKITYVADAMNYINRLLTGATASTQALILEN